MGTDGLDFVINDEWAEFSRLNPWAAFIPEFARDSSGQEFMRVRGRKITYRVASEEGELQTYECGQCDSEIVSARVAHPIHDGPFPLSGSGRCEYESVPYCPSCEEKPSFHGIPISVGPKFR